MDNASKGLITAGAVLVSILLITTGVYVMNTQKPEKYVAEARDKMWLGVDTGVGLGEKSEENLGENVEKLATKKEDFPTTTLRARTLFAGTIPNASIESLVFIDSNTYKAKDGALITEDVGAVKKGEVMAYAYDNDGDNLYEVVVAQPGGVKANANSENFLNGANQLTDINLKYLDTSNTTNMRAMFVNCNKLKVLDLATFNTENVTDMQYMFDWCGGLVDLNVSSFNTEKVQYMNHMFRGCQNLTNIDLSSFNTESVTSIWRCFSGCTSLTHLDLSSFYTPSLAGTGMCLMFENCTNLKSIDLSKFDTTNLTSLQEVFKNCTSLESLDLSSFNTENVTSMRATFESCSSLKELDLSSFVTKKVLDFQSIFNGCSSLEKLNISTFDTSIANDMDLFFNGCSSLNNLILGSNFIIKKGTSAGNITRGANNVVKDLIKDRYEQ